MSYLLNTPDDVRAMLDVIGRQSIDQLFRHIPTSLRLNRPLDVPGALPELALTAHMGALAARNQGADQKPCFLGAGAYDHFIPAAVDQLAGRGEFFTAYTPYQAEASQGTLQAIFEYQTLITQLTGLDVSNASLYDGGSAVAEAAVMALASASKSNRIVIAGAVHPEYRQAVVTLLANLDAQITVVPATTNGTTDVSAIKAALEGGAAALIVQQPNFFGNLEALSELTAAARAVGAASIVSVDAVSLGLLKRPGDCGADIVVAEGQGLGNPLVYGGPYLGIMACRDAYLRKMPGRIVGQTTDRNGKRCWVLTLQTREQHIRREKATSNICTNQGLFALRASIHLALLGPTGLRQVAELSTRKAHYAAQALAAVPGVELAYPHAPFFKEFAIRLPGRDAQAVLDAVEDAGFHGGIALGRWYPELADAVLVAVTEKRTRDEIDRLAAAYRAALS
jgi:glycine dehydrogenase subunit 1